MTAQPRKPKLTAEQRKQILRENLVKARAAKLVKRESMAAGSRGTAGGVARAKKMSALAVLEARRDEYQRRLTAVEEVIKLLRENL